MTHAPKVCATCGVVLDYFSHGDGTEGYGHGVQMLRGDEDHVPIPVDPTVENTNVHCDFCNTAIADPNEDWTVVCKPFFVPGEGVNPETGEPILLNMSSLWAACTACAQLVDGGHWHALHTRVFDTYIAANPKTNFMEVLLLKASLDALYTVMAKNLIEVRRAIPNELADDHKFAPDPRGKP